MTAEGEKVVVVVVIQDASRELSLSTIKWPLQGLSLKSGDKLILLGILHQVNNPSTFSFASAGKLMGFRIKVDPRSMFGTNKKIIAEELDRKIEEYQGNALIEKISEHCKKEQAKTLELDSSKQILVPTTRSIDGLRDFVSNLSSSYADFSQIKFQIEMRAGSPLKEIALKAAKRYHATWIVLDRHMKNDQRYIVENISCNIVRMTKDNNVEELRGPNVKENFKPPAPRTSNVTYAEMIPAISPAEVQSSRKCHFVSESQSVQSSSSVKEQGGEGSGKHPWHSNRKSTSHSVSTLSRLSNRASTSGYNESKSSSSHFHDEEYSTTTGRETVGEHSPASINESGDQKDLHSQDENQKQHNRHDDWMGGNTGDQVFKNFICSICNNRRPKVGWTRDFSFAELQAATEGFHVKNFLSEGGFGSVYRGEINGLKIAVKQHMYNASLQGEKEFKSEVQVLRKARHENLVMLVGSCSEGNHRLLVYEYVCNGSLDLHLSSKA
ncbi:inactive protein kinase SELMODRAFT_444075-like [Durio zibethinus]|uniref:non-specific serine/threonine protein kinase n=1 Tax=Durio zibethinus TaxID=66656 RepID=A0A6P6AHJ2_DURZI|nr:inactive protein kinase SELMODRAFT_444075-like [Durio zibethinus]